MVRVKSILFLTILLASMFTLFGVQDIYSDQSDASLDVDLVIVDRDQYYEPFYNGSCIEFYLYKGPVSYNEMIPFWKELVLDRDLRYRPSARGYENTTLYIERKIKSMGVPLNYILGVGPRFAYPISWYPENATVAEQVSGFVGYALYVPGNVTDDQIEAVYEGLRDFMLEHNLTLLVVFRDPNFTVATPSSPFRFWKMINETDEKDLPRYLATIPKMREAYPMNELVHLSWPHRYPNDGHWRGRTDVVIIGFRAPLPEFNVSDLYDIAVWLDGNAREFGLCGYKIAFVDHLLAPKEKEIGIPTPEPSSPQDSGSRQDVNVSASKSSGTGDVVVENDVSEDGVGIGIPVIAMVSAVTVGVVAVLLMRRRM